MDKYELSRKQVFDQIHAMIRGGKHIDPRHTGYFSKEFQKLVVKGLIVGIPSEELMAVGKMSLQSLNAWKRSLKNDVFSELTKAQQVESEIQSCHERKQQTPPEGEVDKLDFRSLVIRKTEEAETVKTNGASEVCLFKFELPGEIFLITTPGGLSLELAKFLSMMR